MPFFIDKGGIFIWPLLLCSVLALAIVIERVFYFTRNQGPGSVFLSHVTALLRASRVSDVLALSEQTKGPLAHVCKTYLKAADWKKHERDEVLFREGSEQIGLLERRLRGLSLIAEISPLLGLLGTVTGMIRAFQRIQDLGGQINIEALAGGIWEALLTTAVGLAIAIPCMAAFHLFQSRIDRVQARMHYLIAYLNEYVGFGNRTATESGESEESVSCVTGA